MQAWLRRRHVALAAALLQARLATQQSSDESTRMGHVSKRSVHPEHKWAILCTI